SQPLGMILELAGDAGGATVLPAQRRTERGPGLAIPPEHRLSLVPDAARLDLDGRRCQGCPPGVDDRLQQLFGILLDGAAGSRLRMDGRVAPPQNLAPVR